VAIPELLNTALRVLSDVLLYRRNPSAADVERLQAAAPEIAHNRIDDLAAEVVRREMANRKVAKAQGSPSLADLQDDVMQTKTLWLAAIAELDSMASEVPSEIPPPDSTLRIQKAGQKRSDAFRKYRQALRVYREALSRTGAYYPNDPGSGEPSAE
jgi:hypothetical protein